jgi:hypothetical protein
MEFYEMILFRNVEVVNGVAAAAVDHLDVMADGMVEEMEDGMEDEMEDETAIWLVVAIGKRESAQTLYLLPVSLKS